VRDYSKIFGFSAEYLAVYGVFLTFFSVLLIVTGAAFAQVADGISIGTGGKVTFVPVQGVSSDDETVFGAGSVINWGLGADVTLTAADGRVGGQVNIARGADEKYDPTITGGLVNIWTKPFGSDILLIKVGKYEFDEFRGKLSTDSDFSGFIGAPDPTADGIVFSGPGKNEDRIFQRLNANGSPIGAVFVSKPIPGLSLFADVGSAWDSYRKGGVEAKDVYKKVQAGLAYDISGIGLARVQWVGNSMKITETTEDDFYPYTATPARIEAAFNLTAVEGLKLDVGLKFPIPVKEEFGPVDVTYQDNIKIGAAGKFTAGDFGVALGLYGDFAGKIKSDNGDSVELKLAPAFDIIATPSFYLAALDATVGGDVGLKVAGETTYDGTGWEDDSVTFGLGGWITRDLGKGWIKTGLAFSVTSFGYDDADPISSITWPILMGLSF
jgi:hypothetical protein